MIFPISLPCGPVAPKPKRYRNIRQIGQGLFNDVNAIYFKSDSSSIYTIAKFFRKLHLYIYFYYLRPKCWHRNNLVLLEESLVATNSML